MVTLSAQGAPDVRALRAALDSAFAAPDYRWVDAPAAGRLLQRWWQRLGDWLVTLRADNPAAFRLLALGLLLALIVILAHAAYVVWRTIRGASGPSPDLPHGSRPERRDAAWYGRRADAAAAAGRAAEAIQLAFVGLALTLDASGLLQYQASKTPGECAREARVIEQDRERLRELVAALYGYAFGGRPCGLDDYHRWREASGLPWHAPAH